MQNYLGRIVIGLLVSSGLALAQPVLIPPPSSPTPAPGRPEPANQLTPQMLGDMLQSATTFHELVRTMNLNESLGPDQHVAGPDGKLHHPIKRTMQAVGAGAGAGAAIGAMTRGDNGILIGALVGSAGGLIIDQILRHREKKRERAFFQQFPNGAYAPQEFDGSDWNDPALEY